MAHQYLVLIDNDPRGNLRSAFTAQEAKLRAMGMRSCLTCGPIRLFVSEDTPTLATPDGGMVIGHLFSNDGTFVGAKDLLKFSSPLQFGKHLLEHYWGEYLLVQPVAGHDRNLEILLDPSGGIPCVYATQGSTTFVTSGISLAMRLALYRTQIDWEFIAQVLAYPHIKTRAPAGPRSASCCRAVRWSCAVALQPSDRTGRPGTSLQHRIGIAIPWRRRPLSEEQLPQSSGHGPK